MSKYCLFLIAVSCALFNYISATSDIGGITTQVTQGYRRDRLVWSISGPKKHPNILSELKYRDVSIYQTRLNTRLSNQDYFTKLNLGYGIVLDGTCRDSDYLMNNRRAEFSRSYSKITGDYTFDAVIQFGKDFRLDPHYTLSPTVGYGVYSQKFRVKNGKQDIDMFASGSKIHGLNSTYKATWFGPQIGARITGNVCENMNVFAEYTLSFPMSYRGTGFWNLRAPKERNFTQTSRGFGQIGQLGADYEFAKNWTVGAEYQLSQFTAHGGTSKKHIWKTPFRKACLTSNETRLTLSYAF